MPARTLRIGLISDTHGVLRPEALAALADSDFIVHAGDIGDAGIVARLARIAPVTAVRGNNDFGAWARAIPETAELAAGPTRIYVIHDRATLSIDPAAAGYHVVVSGHSHRPGFDERERVLYVNPGSAGPRRFTLPVSVGVLTIAEGAIAPRLLTLDVRAVR